MTLNVHKGKLMNTLSIAPFVKHYDKRYETDQKMLQRVAMKFALIFFVIVMFDPLLDWTISAFYLVMHLVHFMIEAIEYSFVLLFAQIFQTSSHLSEIILVNGVIVIALWFAYRSISAAPVWYKHLKRDL